MRKITIHLSYAINDDEEYKADDLYDGFQSEFKKVFPNADLQSVFIAKENFEKKE